MVFIASERFIVSMRRNAALCLSLSNLEKLMLPKVIFGLLNTDKKSWRTSSSFLMRDIDSKNCM